VSLEILSIIYWTALYTAGASYLVYEVREFITK